MKCSFSKAWQIFLLVWQPTLLFWFHSMLLSNEFCSCRNILNCWVWGKRVRPRPLFPSKTARFEEEERLWSWGLATEDGDAEVELCAQCRWAGRHWFGYCNSYLSISRLWQFFHAAQLSCFMFAFSLGFCRASCSFRFEGTGHISCPEHFFDFAIEQEPRHRDSQ